MRININMRHNVLLLFALLVSTSMYGRSEIDTIRITFAQVDGYATSRSTVSYAYQNDEYQLQTTEPSFPHRIKDLPNTINKGCVSKLLNDVSLYSDKSQCDYISITKEDYADYIKTLTSNKLVILLEKPYEQNNSTQFWTKEATDISNHEESAFSYTFKAADLVPQLIVTYKDTGATAISDVKVENFKVAEGAYTLSGQRVTKPTKGLYIVNGKKVVIK